MSNSCLHFVPLRSIKLSFLLLVRFEVAANKNNAIFSGRAQDTKKLKKGAIFDSQEYERNVLPNLRRWLTTSSRVKTQGYVKRGLNCKKHSLNLG